MLSQNLALHFPSVPRFPLEHLDVFNALLN